MGTFLASVPVCRTGAKRSHTTESAFLPLLPASAQEVGDRRFVALDASQHAVVDGKLQLVRSRRSRVVEIAILEQLEIAEFDVHDPVVRVLATQIGGDDPEFPGCQRSGEQVLQNVTADQEVRQTVGPVLRIPENGLRDDGDPFAHCRERRFSFREIAGIPPFPTDNVDCCLGSKVGDNGILEEPSLRKDELGDVRSRVVFGVGVIPIESLCVAIANQPVKNRVLKREVARRGRADPVVPALGRGGDSLRSRIGSGEGPPSHEPSLTSTPRRLQPSLFVTWLSTGEPAGFCQIAGRRHEPSEAFPPRCPRCGLPLRDQ